MHAERLKVSVGLGTHLQLFIDATIEKLQRHEPLSGIQKDYVENINLMQRLVRECAERLSPNDPWQCVFERLDREVKNLYDTMFLVPVLEHIHALESIAYIHDRCTGVPRWYDFLLGDGEGGDKEIMQTVKNEPLRGDTVRDKFRMLIVAIERQVEYANTVKAYLKE